MRDPGAGVRGPQGGLATRWIGLMSGTSLDGVDGVLVELEPSEGSPRVDSASSSPASSSPASASPASSSPVSSSPASRSSVLPSPASGGAVGAGPYLEARIERVVSLEWSARQRAARLEAIERGGAAELARLHRQLAEDYAGVVQQLLAEAGVRPDQVAAIGCHGQTVWHEPPGAVTGAPGPCGVSLQLGDAATLAARTGIGVVHDFRSADLAAGGQGAPLVPWADRALFSHRVAARLIVNIGGMANVTWLPARGHAEPVLAFDTGPGNVWLDHAAVRATGGAQSCDLDGRIAATGAPLPERLEALLADPFFARRPPRSTGREHFSSARLDRWLVAARGAGHDWPDLLATLTVLTADSIAAAVAAWIRPRPIDEVVVAGGGARNPTLLRALSAALERHGVRARPQPAGPALGCDAQAREALAFAALAWANRHGIPANLPECTGASGPRVLGSWTPAPL